MALCHAKSWNIFILILSSIQLLLVCTVSGFTISYFILYDNYYFLLDNPLAGLFMTLLSITCVSSTGSVLYSLYVSDKLAQHFSHSRENDSASEYMSTFLVKVVKGIATIACVITFIMTSYDLSTTDVLFFSKGILKSIQVCIWTYTSYAFDGQEDNGSGFRRQLLFIPCVGVQIRQEYQSVNRSTSNGLPVLWAPFL